MVPGRVAGAPRAASSSWAAVVVRVARPNNTPIGYISPTCQRRVCPACGVACARRAGRRRTARRRAGRWGEQHAGAGGQQQAFVAGQADFGDQQRVVLAGPRQNLRGPVAVVGEVLTLVLSQRALRRTSCRQHATCRRSFVSDDREAGWSSAQTHSCARRLRTRARRAIGSVSLARWLTCSQAKQRVEAEPTRSETAPPG